MKVIPILLLLFIPVLLEALPKGIVVWEENNLQINFRGELKVREHSDRDISLLADNNDLYIKILDDYFKDEQLNEFLKSIIENKGYKLCEEPKVLYKDFLKTIYAEADRNGYRGIFFLLRDDLNGDKLFLGYLTTVTRPKANAIGLVENFKVREEGEAETISQDNDGVNDNQIKGLKEELETLIKEYSPKISSIYNYLTQLPKEVNGTIIGGTFDISGSYKDSIPYTQLYYQSWFISDLFFNLNNTLSTLATIQKQSQGVNEEYFSVLSDSLAPLLVKKVKVPPASIIQKTYPEQFKEGNYADCIYPSSLNRTTQVDGIYGLISEFTAACYKLKWYDDFLKYYNDKKQASNSFFLKYIYYFPYSAYSTLQFKHYIIRYLSEIRREDPKTYSLLMDDSNFKQMITTYIRNIDSRINEFNGIKLKIRDDIGNQYLPFIEDESKLLIDEYQYNDNKRLVLFNSLVDYIDHEASYQPILLALGIKPGEKIIIIRE
jgi:hypothetical protein